MYKKTFFLIVIFSFSIYSCKNDTHLKLVTKGKSKYKIILPDQAKAKELEAAEIFKKNLYQLSNVSFEIVRDSKPPSDYEILIGNTNRDESKRLKKESKK